MQLLQNGGIKSGSFLKIFYKVEQKRLHFLKKYSNINKRLTKALHFAEMSEWFKEHDWKSCVRLKRTGGSNPLLCANNALTDFSVWALFRVLIEVRTSVRFAPPLAVARAD